MGDPAAHWNRIRHILAEAMELAPVERGRFLARACAGDADLRRDVDVLLESSVGAEGFLEELAGRAGLPFAGPEHAPPAGLRRVGAYRLLRRIGEGGMGAVYLADRADGEFEMRVAVKLLPTGLHTDVMQRRFAAERRILARLAHPGIGRLLDGGVTEDGIPFLVMEYAAGVPIDSYCDDNLLDIDARVSLFLEVCDAVEFAHSHEVVHRDLKPTNILVSADGQVKLLDFGIAKVLAGDAGPDSTLTTWGGAPLTPLFASPEQIKGEPAGFGSDVYQLAALLYLLLTGRLPTDPVDSGSWAELARAVASRRIIPASSAAGMPGQGRRGLAGPTPEQRARARRTGVAALRSRLAGEIDAILLKALRDDPTRRYRSVAALAGEIRRNRDGHPVAASLEVHVRPTPLKRVEPTPSRTPAPERTVPIAPSIRTDHVAVLPFAGASNEALSYLRHGLVSLLAAALDDSGVISSIEPTAILAALPPADTDVADAAAASAQAEQLGAGLYVLGEVVEVGELVRISASLHDVGDDREPRVTAVAEGSTDQVFDLVDTLAIEILCAVAPSHSADLVGTAARTTSLAGLKLFMRGEQALHAGAFFAAADAYQRAVEADPHFALGYYRLAIAAYWAHNLGLTRRFAAEAAARSDRLPVRERRLLAALELYLDGRASAAEASYQALLDEDPGDLEAAFLMGTLLFFHNALRGRSHAEARPYFERVLANQPGHILSLLYLSTIVARAGDLRALDRLTERLLDVYPEGGVPAYPIVARAQRTFASHNAAARDRALEELRRAGSLAAITAANVAVLARMDLSGADRIVQLLVAEPEPPEVRATGHVLRAHLELGGGRIDAAESELELAHGLGSVEALEFRTLFALAPFLSAGKPRLEGLRAALLDRDRADPADAPPPIPHFAPHHGVHAHAQLFLLGLVNARLGEYDDALDRAHELEAAASSSDDIALRSFAETIRAEVAAGRDGPAAALAVLEAHELGTSVERALSSSLYAHGHARLTRADLLRANGRPDEALAWYRTFGDNSLQDAIYLAPAQFRQAEILQSRGDVPGALVHYRRFLELWRTCDPLLEPTTAAARRALARLGAALPPSAIA
jgi:serine/threonine protein kinase/tetratricopeptide (TPR) repeat protein